MSGWKKEPTGIVNTLRMGYRDFKQYGFKIAFYNVRFIFCLWLLGNPKRMSVTPRKR